jgi:general secretion pathway protein C
VAIIVAEGSPPKALKVGKELVPGITLAEVHPRYVMLSDGGVMKRLDLAADTRPAAAMDAGGQGGPAAVAMPANLAPGAAVPEPPMSPGAVQQQPQPGQELAPQGDAGQPLPPPATPNIAAPNNPNAGNPSNPNANNQNANNPAPPPVQMPPPTRPAGSPVGGAAPTTQ